MTTFVFKGLVLPERAQISLGPYKAEITYPFDGTQHKAEVNIVLNHITIYIHSDRDWQLDDLKNVVVQIARDLVNIAGYIRGYGYDVEISQVLNREKNIGISISDRGIYKYIYTYWQIIKKC